MNGARQGRNTGRMKVNSVKEDKYLLMRSEAHTLTHLSSSARSGGQSERNDWAQLQMQITVIISRIAVDFTPRRKVDKAAETQLTLPERPRRKKTRKRK